MQPARFRIVVSAIALAVFVAVPFDAAWVTLQARPAGRATRRRTSSRRCSRGAP